jgi:hypothetical protein
LTRVVHTNVDATKISLEHFFEKQLFCGKFSSIQATVAAEAAKVEAEERWQELSGLIDSPTFWQVVPLPHGTGITS